MTLVQAIANRVGRLIFALVCAGALFFLLALANVMFRNVSGDANRSAARNVNLVHVVPPEKQRKQEPQRAMRKLSLSSRSNISRDIVSKFTPDLTIGGAGDGAAMVPQQTFENIIYEEGQTEEPPAVLFSVQPRYPNQARDQGLGGTVSVIIVIERNGRASQVTFENLPHEIFKKPVEEAIARWRFKPAHHKGVPVRIRVRQQFDFGVM